MKKLLSMILSFAMLIGVFTPIASAQTNSEKNTMVQSNGIPIGISNEVDEHLEKISEEYVAIENNKFVITNQNELSSQVSLEEYKQIQYQVNYVNESLAEFEQDKLKTEGNSVSFEADSIYNDPEAQDTPEIGTNAAVDIYKYKGKSKIVFHLWDIHVWVAKIVVGIVLVGTASAGAYYLGRVFPGANYALRVAIASGIIGYISGEVARPIYANIWYTNGIRHFKIF